MVKYPTGLEKIVQHIEKSVEFQENGNLTLQEKFIRNKVIGVLAGSFVSNEDMDIKIRKEIIPELEKQDWSATWHDFYRKLNVYKKIEEDNQHNSNTSSEPVNINVNVPKGANVNINITEK